MSEENNLDDIMDELALMICSNIEQSHIPEFIKELEKKITTFLEDEGEIEIDESKLKKEKLVVGIDKDGFSFLKECDVSSESSVSDTDSDKNDSEDETE